MGRGRLRHARASGSPKCDEDRRAGERARLDALAALVETAGCRRAVLLRHFGEDPPETLRQLRQLPRRARA